MWKVAVNLDFSIVKSGTEVSLSTQCKLSRVNHDMRLLRTRVVNE
jgi:hypothetical protein